MDTTLAPGDWVRHPAEPGWGLGRVQSALGTQVTVNFEHAGKQIVDLNYVTLVEIASDGDPPPVR